MVGGRPDRTGCTRRNGNGTARGSENLEARKQVRWNRTCVLRGSGTASSRPRGLEHVRPLRDDASSWRRRQQPSSSSASGRRRGAPGVCLLALVLVFSTAFALPTHSELGCTCCRTEEKFPLSSEALQRKIRRKFQREKKRDREESRNPGVQRGGEREESVAREICADELGGGRRLGGGEVGISRRGIVARVVAPEGGGGGGSDPRDDPTALKEGDLSLGYAYARTTLPPAALTNAIPWGRAPVYGTHHHHHHREIYHNILSSRGGGDSDGGVGDYGAAAATHGGPSPHGVRSHGSNAHVVHHVGGSLQQHGAAAAGYESREVLRTQDTALAAVNFDEEEEEEAEEGSSNSGSGGVGKQQGTARNNHPSSIGQQGWPLSVRQQQQHQEEEEEEGEEDVATTTTQGMNVQSLQQHNPSHGVVVAPPEPDNHLHLHEPRPEELWGGGAGGVKGNEIVVQQQIGGGAGGGAPVAGALTTGTGSSACQECGNQAKKDCSYRRCRTCCKSRGFDCTTHLKSTWVPAAKRRERQAAESAAAAAASAGLLRPKSSKRARNTLVGNVVNSLTTTSATSPRGGSDLNSAHLTSTHPSQPTSAKGGLPPEVRAQALFKCVRLMGVEDGENEFAYQATVKIGGHIFKGVLYDQGVDNGQPAAQSLGELQLGGSRGGMPSSSALIDPASLYVSGSALLGALR